MLGGDKFAVPKDLGLLIRYQTSAENAFHKAHNELVKAQKERKKSEIGFESQKPAAKPETEAKTIPITWVDPPETASSGAPDRPDGLTGFPEAPNMGIADLKNVA